MPPVDAATVRNHIAKSLRLKPEKVKDEALLSDLVAESFALVEMTIDLQEEYGIVLKQSELNSHMTVGQLATLVASKTA